MIVPQQLRPGDRIAIAAPARKVSRDEVAPFVQLIEQQGFEAILPEGLFAEENQMAGNDTHRANLMQR